MSNRISIAKHPYPLISGTISLLIGKEKHLFCFYQSWHCLRMPQSSMEVAAYIIAYKNGKTTCSFVQLLCDDKGGSMMGTQWSTRDWTTQCMNFARVLRVFRSILKKSCHMYSTRWPEAIALVSKSNLQKIVDSMVSLVHAQCHLFRSHHKWMRIALVGTFHNHCVARIAVWLQYSSFTHINSSSSSQ